MFRKYFKFVFSLILMLIFCTSLFAKDNPRSIFGGSRQAENSALSILSEKPEAYSLEKTKSGDYVFYPSEKTVAENPEKKSAGFIFYPGGKVQCEAYLPLLKALAEKGYLSILVHMPGDLAIFNQNGAKKFIKQFPEIKHWFISGHSLGGAMASVYASGKSEIFDGIILLAAYSTKKIDENISVLSLYGSCDGVLSMHKYEKYWPNLPSDFTEKIIEGGCHSYFGDYGMQDGDGSPSISREEQMDIVLEAIDTFIRSKI